MKQVFIAVDYLDVLTFCQLLQPDNNIIQVATYTLIKAILLYLSNN